MSEAASASEPRPWKRGALWLAFLGPFFFASYGLGNWLASQRAGVGALVFEWEYLIPFLAWTIVPYWTIDLCYAASLVLCATRRQLAIHVKRLLVAQLLAVTCFIAFPLRYSFERPAVDSVFGWMFAALSSFDLPYNQAPSLHIALLLILWHFYRQVVPRAWHPALHAGSVLIGVSVLTTWQHHFIDIPTGAWLGAFCLFLFPDDARSPWTARLSLDRTRRALALRYALAAFALGGAALVFGGSALWLLWPAGSLGLVAAAYAFGTDHAFGKRVCGTMSAASMALHAPYLLGAWINARLWTRRLPIAHEVARGVYLGRIPDRRALKSFRIAAVVDLCAELPGKSDGVRYASVPMLDLIVPSSDRIEAAAIAIERAASYGPVWVCCALGFSRSALAVGAWLIRSGAVESVDEAIERVRTARPGIVLSSAHRDALAQWQYIQARDRATAPAHDAVPLSRDGEPRLLGTT